MKKNKKIEVNLTFEPMKGMGGGFRTDWISAKNENLVAGIDSGAGLGNPYLTFWIEEKPGQRKYFTADLREVLPKIIDLAKGAA